MEVGVHVLLHVLNFAAELFELRLLVRRYGRAQQTDPGPGQFLIQLLRLFLLRSERRGELIGLVLHHFLTRLAEVRFLN